MSSRRALMEALTEQAKAVRNGSYFVKRGAIDWADFEFVNHPAAISVQLVSHQLLASGRTGLREGLVAIEIFRRMPEGQARPEIDDALMDQIQDDAESIVDGLIASLDAQGDAVVIKVERDSSSVEEAHDVTLGVQGVVCTLRVGF